jgi:hypothetical protein
MKFTVYASPDYNSQVAEEINLEVTKTNSLEDRHIVKGIIRLSEKKNLCLDIIWKFVSVRQNGSFSRVVSGFH